MKNITLWLYEHLLDIGVSEIWAKYTNMFVLFFIGIILIFILDYLLRKLIISIFSRISSRSKTKFDDFLLTNKAPRNIAHFIALVVGYELIPFVFVHFEDARLGVEKTIKVFGIVLILWIARSLLNTLKDFFKTLENFKDKPIDSYIQVFMIFAWIAGFMMAFAIITDTSIWKFLTALGAASAVIILIFRDTILGFVASIQVSINDMVRIGDWITFEKYGADGDVTEINLATVKVQNFDKTITTIPTYALISDSFRNWRGMMNSEGRRIKRSLILKQQSVKFLSRDEVADLKKIERIASYLEIREKEIDTHNSSKNVNKDLLMNGRNLTNLGVFRKYIEVYIDQHSGINSDMMIMARQLEPTAQGIPLEIYAFSSDKRWQNYEYIMADIFDHLIAALPTFRLELFELPSTTDFNS